MEAAHSSAVQVLSSWPMVSDTVSLLRSAALRSRCFSLANTCSIGFEVGRILGQQKQLGAAESDIGREGRDSPGGLPAAWLRQPILY